MLLSKILREKEWVASLPAFRNSWCALPGDVPPFIQLYIQINGRQTMWPSWSIERGMSRREKQSKEGGRVGRVRVRRWAWRWNLREWSRLWIKVQRLSNSIHCLCSPQRVSDCVCSSVCLFGGHIEAEPNNGSHCNAGTWPGVVWHRLMCVNRHACSNTAKPKKKKKKRNVCGLIMEICL